MLPVYLPLTIDEPDQSAGVPIFFGGISVYLEQKSTLFARFPRWFHQWLASPRVLKWASGKTASTRAAELGEMTLSMLQGEEGRQARELDALVDWLKQQPKPDAIFLSNALLGGLTPRLRAELGAPVVCALQGEDTFLDALPESHRARCWRAAASRAAKADLLVAPSQYFATLMARRLALPAESLRVVFNGINLDGYSRLKGVPNSGYTKRPVIGFFARMCREKGLDTLIEAFILFRKRGRVPDARLRIGGSCGPRDEPFLASLKPRLESAGLLASVEFCPNLNHQDKLRFLSSLAVFSVPAEYGEAFGLYLIEAMAAGVPVVQPNSGAFPELIEATGGGLVCPAQDAAALSNSIEELLCDPDRAEALGRAGQDAVFSKFSADAMAARTLEVIEELRSSVRRVQELGLRGTPQQSVS